MKQLRGTSEKGDAMKQPRGVSGKDDVVGGRMHSGSVGIWVAVVGLLMAAWGIYRGEMSVVFEKAVNICMECIGIG